MEAQGPLRVIEETEELQGLLTELTTTHETSQPHAWKLEDAPENYLADQCMAVMGIELAEQKLTGKWKMSLSRSEADLAGMKANLPD